MIPSDGNIYLAYPLLRRHGYVFNEREQSVVSCNYVTNYLTFKLLNNHQDGVYKTYHLVLVVLFRVSTRRFIRTNKQCTLYFGKNIQI